MHTHRLLGTSASSRSPRSASSSPGGVAVAGQVRSGLGVGRGEHEPVTGGPQLRTRPREHRSSETTAIRGVGGYAGVELTRRRQEHLHRGDKVADRQGRDRGRQRTHPATSEAGPALDDFNGRAEVLLEVTEYGEELSLLPV